MLPGARQPEFGRQAVVAFTFPASFPAREETQVPDGRREPQEPLGVGDPLTVYYLLPA